jgi:hypothetical protein
MEMRVRTNSWGKTVAGVMVLIGCWVAAAQAGFPPPDLPFQPPKGLSPEPPIIVQPVVPPQVHSAPEPATLVTGLIGAGLAGVAAYRRRRQTSAGNE